MKVDPKFVGMVRVALVGCHKYARRASVDYNECQEDGNVLWTSFWYRHDEPDLNEKLEQAKNIMVKACFKLEQYSGAVVTLQYRDYAKPLR